MKLSEYIKGRLPAYLTYAGGWIMALLFMGAFHIQTQAAVIITVIMLLTVTAAELPPLIQRMRFYGKLRSNIQELDQKYLISEMLEDPGFPEGDILCDVIRDADRSMYEHITEYRNENVQFREFIEMWVHEIKLPVAGLLLMCHNDGNTRYTGQVKRIDSLIENVLYYARSGSAEKDYIIKETDLKRVFADSAVKYREELQERSVSVSAEGLSISVMTDGKWLGYIFGQLFSNSMKYFSPDREPEIKVTAEDFPDKTVLHFRDNGTGIPESDLPYIFEKSFTGENGRTHGRSTGMGLYIIKQLCGKLGHCISAESVKGEYTDIIITFGRNDLHDVV